MIKNKWSDIKIEIAVNRSFMMVTMVHFTLNGILNNNQRGRKVIFSFFWKEPQAFQ